MKLLFRAQVTFFFFAISVFGFAQQRLELPKIKSNEIVVKHKGHTLSYNPDWLLPNWVAYELCEYELEGEAQRMNRFLPDPLLEKYPCAEHWHYTHSGWARGHMIPAGDLKNDQQAMNDSFFTSNVCPMNIPFNNSIWKRLEEKCRDWARKYGRVYIITGPIIGDNKNGKVGDSDILIPDAFYKAVLIPIGDSFISVAFIMQNAEATSGKLRDFAMTVDDLERVINMDLFNGLGSFAELKVEHYLPLKELGLF